MPCIKTARHDVASSSIDSIPFGKASLSKIIIGSNAFALPDRSVVVTSLTVILVTASGHDYSHPSLSRHASRNA